MRQCFAQLSDPHLSSLHDVRAADLLNKRALGYLSWRRKRRYEHRREVLDALLRDLATEEFNQLLVTGDLTHVGLPSEFEQARDWLMQLGDPSKVALVPGNHDACVATDWQHTFALWRDYMASDASAGTQQLMSFPTLRVRDNIAFIGLSTACPKPPLMATGTLGQKQLTQLPSLLDDAADKNLFRVVYLHHCPIVGQEKWRKRLTDAAAVQTILQQHGAELILHGHGHRSHYSELQSAHGCIPVIAVPSASALGLHSADIGQYNQYRVQRTDVGWNLSIVARCYQAKTGEYSSGPHRAVKLARS